jgi:hypothetical protein
VSTERELGQKTGALIDGTTTPGFFSEELISEKKGAATAQCPCQPGRSKGRGLTKDSRNIATPATPHVQYVYVFHISLIYVYPLVVGFKII